MIKYLFSVAIGTLLIGCQHTKKIESDSNLPNIVYIFTDDLGYGDIGCFGAKDIKTPNIDNLASEGIQFNDFYSASPICTPSRAGLLTGRLPLRMGVNLVFFPESFTGMPQEEITIAEMLKEKGYTSGIVGKWHLGHHYQYLPLQQGFDSYFGMPYSNDMASVVYMEGNEVVEFNVDQRYTTKTYTEKAIEFIEKNQENPFFLYLAHNMPHVPIYASEDFLGTSDRGLYGDVVQEIDWSVGEIVKKLEDVNLLDNTLVIFSSDNGPWLVMEDLGGSAGILREGKQFTFEGGVRVPTVAMWRNKIPKGQIFDYAASQLDWFPTIAGITNIKIPDHHILDGVDISNVLFGEGERTDSTILYFDGVNELQCYRNGSWKVKMPYKGFKGAPYMSAVAAHDTLLFNLKDDPGEKNNIYHEFPEKAIQLLKEMNQKYTDLGEIPPHLFIRSGGDYSHFDYLNKKKNRK